MSLLPNAALCVQAWQAIASFMSFALARYMPFSLQRYESRELSSPSLCSHEFSVPHCSDTPPGLCSSISGKEHQNLVGRSKHKIAKYKGHGVQRSSCHWSSPSPRIYLIQSPVCLTTATISLQNYETALTYMYLTAMKCSVATAKQCRPTLCIVKYCYRNMKHIINIYYCTSGRAEQENIRFKAGSIGRP